jgi:hypothetical protein
VGLTVALVALTTAAKDAAHGIVHLTPAAVGVYNLVDKRLEVAMENLVGTTRKVFPPTSTTALVQMVRLLVLTTTLTDAPLNLKMGRKND